jgi:hypothetical protein
MELRAEDMETILPVIEDMVNTHNSIQCRGIRDEATEIDDFKSSDIIKTEQ